jgi:hypothetical protein
MDRDTNKTRPRVLHIHGIVLDRSSPQFERIRAVRPDKIARIPVADDEMKTMTHGFERTDRSDNVSTLITFPKIPKMNMQIPKEKLIFDVISFKYRINSFSSIVALNEDTQQQGNSHFLLLIRATRISIFCRHI